MSMKLWNLETDVHNHYNYSLEGWEKWDAIPVANKNDDNHSKDSSVCRLLEGYVFMYSMNQG